MKTSLIAILILLFAFTSCQKTKTNLEDQIDEIVLKEIPNLPEKSAELINSDNGFGLELFRQVVGLSEKNKNTTVSPLSVSLALAMTYNGALGETKTEIEKALKLSGLTPEQINNSHKALVEVLKSADSKVTLEIANAIFYRQGFTILPDFISTNQNFYNAEVNAVNFSSPDEALKTINGWVTQKTHDKIPTIIDKIEPDLSMILLNAIYFNGIWKSKFGEKDTRILPFYLGDGTKKDIATMKLTTSLEYTSNELFSAVNLPYGNGQFQMTVLLPNEGKTTKDIISELNTKNWQGWMRSFKSENSVVIMPRFKFSWDLKLNEILNGLGMKQAFIPDLANFSGINGKRDLYIGSVIHKTFVDVNENGTEAAAITTARITTSSGSGAVDLKKYLIVNRPFIFAITEKTTGAILFIGEVTNPEYPL